MRRRRTNRQKDKELRQSSSRHIHNNKNPHRVTADQVGAYTREQIDELLKGLDDSLFTLSKGTEEKLDAVGEAINKAIAETIENLESYTEEEINKINDSLTEDINDVLSNLNEYKNAQDDFNSDVEEFINNLDYYTQEEIDAISNNLSEDIGNVLTNLNEYKGTQSDINDSIEQTINNLDYYTKQEVRNRDQAIEDSITQTINNLDFYTTGEVDSIQESINQNISDAIGNLDYYTTQEVDNIEEGLNQSISDAIGDLDFYDTEYIDALATSISKDIDESIGNLDFYTTEDVDNIQDSLNDAISGKVSLDEFYQSVKITEENGLLVTGYKDDVEVSRINLRGSGQTSDGTSYAGIHIQKYENGWESKFWANEDGDLYLKGSVQLDSGSILVGDTSRGVFIDPVLGLLVQDINSRVVLNATDDYSGINIQKNEGTTEVPDWTSTFFVDDSGDLYMKGNLQPGSIIVGDSSNGVVIDENLGLLVQGANSRTLINADGSSDVDFSGISIQAKDGDNWVSNFYADREGNVYLKGTLQPGSILTGTVSEGVTLDPDLGILVQDDNTRILLNSTATQYSGITIQSREGESWTSNFYADEYGNLYLKGTLQSGTILSGSPDNGVIIDQNMGVLVQGENTRTLINSDSSQDVDFSGINIQSKEGTGWVSNFYADHSGNVFMRGTLQPGTILSGTTQQGVIIDSDLGVLVSDINSRILLGPSENNSTISIQALENGEWISNFYTNSQGDLFLRGSLQAGSSLGDTSHGVVLDSDLGLLVHDDTNNVRVTLSADSPDYSGISIQQYNGEDWNLNFYADPSGNVHLKGTLDPGTVLLGDITEENSLSGIILDEQLGVLVQGNGTRTALNHSGIDGNNTAYSGISIQKLIGDTWTHSFYADSSGDVFLRGTLEAGTSLGHPDKGVILDSDLGVLVHNDNTRITLNAETKTGANAENYAGLSIQQKDANDDWNLNLYTDPSGNLFMKGTLQPGSVLVGDTNEGVLIDEDLGLLVQGPNTRVLLNASSTDEQDVSFEGINIQALEGGTWKSNFYVNPDGDIYTRGRFGIMGGVIDGDIEMGDPVTLRIGPSASVPSINLHSQETYGDYEFEIDGVPQGSTRTTVEKGWYSVNESNTTAVLLFTLSNIDVLSWEQTSHISVSIVGRNNYGSSEIISTKTYTHVDTSPEQYIVGNTFEYDQIGIRFNLVLTRKFPSDLSLTNTLRLTSVQLNQQSSSIALTKEGLFQRIAPNKIIPYGEGGAGGSLTLEGNRFEYTWDDIYEKPDTASDWADETGFDGRYADKDNFEDHLDDENNPHNVTKAQVGLSNVRNVTQYSQTEANNRFLQISNNLSEITNVEGSKNFDSNVTIQGSLVVQGEAFKAFTQTVEIENNLAILNSGEVGDGITAGFAGWEADRGTLTNYRWGFDEPSDLWKIGEPNSLQAVATRPDSPNNNGIAIWDSVNDWYETHTDLTFDGSTFKVSSNSLFEDTVNLDATIKSSDFTSRTLGWEITKGGVADFRSLYSDEIRTEAFIAEISQALAGSDFLTKSVGVLSRNFTIPSTGDSSTLYVEDLEGQEGSQVFVSGDTVRLRVVDKSGGGLIAVDVWGTVSGYEDLSGGEQSWTFTVTDDGEASGSEIYAGSVALDYGTSGDGFIERTVLDPYSPYSQVVTWDGDPSDSNNYTVHTRLGEINGIPNAEGYGLYGENTFLTGSLLAGDLTKSGHFMEFKDGELTIDGILRVQGSNVASEGYADQAVEDLEVGGRNYIVLGNMRSYSNYNTTPEYEGNVITTVITHDNNWFTLGINGYSPSNEMYTLSGVMKVNGTPITINDFNHRGASTYVETTHSISVDSSGYFEIVSTYNPDEHSWIFHTKLDVVTGDVITIEELKFEKGSKATDWTPAPEDVQDSITSARETAEENLASNLGYDNYDDMLSKAQNDNTIINGGHLRTSLVEADAVFANVGHFINNVSFGEDATQKIGQDVGGSGVHGYHIDSDNYWYTTGAFQIGGDAGITYPVGNDIVLGSDTVVEGDISGASGTFKGGISGTGYYINNNGFELADGLLSGTNESITGAGWSWTSTGFEKVSNGTGIKLNSSTPAIELLVGNSARTSFNPNLSVPPEGDILDDGSTSSDTITPSVERDEEYISIPASLVPHENFVVDMTLNSTEGRTTGTSYRGNVQVQGYDGSSWNTLSTANFEVKNGSFSDRDRRTVDNIGNYSSFRLRVFHEYVYAGDGRHGPSYRGYYSFDWQVYESTFMINGKGAYVRTSDTTFVKLGTGSGGSTESGAITGTITTWDSIDNNPFTSNNPSDFASSDHDHGYSDLPFGSNTYMPKSGGTFSGETRFDGGLHVDTYTGSNNLYISRLGNTNSQVLSIGLSDRTVNFNYIEDTTGEGTGDFGRYRFFVGGNDGESDIETILFDHNQFTYKNNSVYHEGNLSASDIGLGNVENIALSQANWSDIGINKSDVSKSDVGLGNVRNFDPFPDGDTQALGKNDSVVHGNVQSKGGTESGRFQINPDTTGGWDRRYELLNNDELDNSLSVAFGAYGNSDGLVRAYIGIDRIDNIIEFRPDKSVWINRNGAEPDEYTFRVNGTSYFAKTLTGADASFSSGISASYLNTGQGNNELHPMDQGVRTTDAVEFPEMSRVSELLFLNNQTLLELEDGNLKEGDHGQFISIGEGTDRRIRIGVVDNGSIRTEIELRDENSGKNEIVFKTGVGVPERAKFTSSGLLELYEGLDVQDTLTGVDAQFSSGISATTLNTGQGDNELHPMNQSVTSNNDPTFDGLNLTDNLYLGLNHIYVDTNTTSGWARALNFRDSEGNNLVAFGGHGSGDSLNKGYIGTGYNDTWLEFRPDSTELKNTLTGVDANFSGQLQIGDYLRANPTDNRFEVWDSQGEKSAMGYLDNLPKNDGSGTWDSNDYGFWVKQGDTLTIDGDVNYDNGDWLIENDATVRIQDGITGNDIIALGTDSGDKGLFLYDADEALMASLTHSAFKITDNVLVRADKSGYIAGGNIAWTSSGDVTFDPSVSLAWENYADGAVEDLEVGGRNLVTNSEDIESHFYTRVGAEVSWSEVDMSSEWGFSNAYKATVDLTNYEDGQTTAFLTRHAGMVFDQEYIYSLYIKNVSNETLNFNTNGLEPDGANTFSLVSGESKRIEVSGQRRQDYDWFQFRLSTDGNAENRPDSVELILGRIKFEKGSKATDWTPAPEDTQTVDWLNDAGALAKLSEIEGTHITQSSVTTNHLNVQTLSSITGNVGTLISGKIQSSDESIVFDLDNNKLTSDSFDLNAGGMTISNSNGISFSSSNSYWKRNGDVRFISGDIAGWGIRNTTLSKIQGDVEISLGIPDSWASSVWGLQIGEDSSNRIWLGNNRGTYELNIRKNSNDIVRLGGGTNHVAGWDIHSNRLEGSNVNIWSSGTIEHKGGAWELHSNGSGHLADGAISWENDGSVEIGADVDIFGKLKIGPKTFHRIYAVGSGNNQSNQDEQLRVNGETIYTSHNRGLMLTVLDSDMNVRHSQRYDMYNENQDRTDLGNLLLGNENLDDGDVLEDTDVVVLTSQDAHRAQSNQTVIDGIDSVGGDYTTFEYQYDNNIIGHRTPYVLIGQKGLGRGNGFEAWTNDGEEDPHARMSVQYADGSLYGMQSSFGTKIHGDKISTGSISSNNGNLTFDLDNEILTATNEFTLDAGGTLISPDHFIFANGILEGGTEGGNWIEIDTDEFTLNRDGSATLSGNLDILDDSGNTAIKVGNNVGSNLEDGLIINTHNYWYGDGSKKFGDQDQFVEWDADESSLRAKGSFIAESLDVMYGDEAQSVWHTGSLPNPATQDELDEKIDQGYNFYSDAMETSGVLSEGQSDTIDIDFGELDNSGGSVYLATYLVTATLQSPRSRDRCFVTALVHNAGPQNNSGVAVLSRQIGTSGDLDITSLGSPSQHNADNGYKFRLHVDAGGTSGNYYWYVSIHKISGFRESDDIPDTTPPPAPTLTNSDITGDCASRSINWDGVSASDFSHYEVFRVSSVGNRTLLGTTTSTSFTADNTNYCYLDTSEWRTMRYQVDAIDTLGNRASSDVAEIVVYGNQSVDPPQVSTVRATTKANQDATTAYFTGRVESTGGESVSRYIEYRKQGESSWNAIIAGNGFGGEYEVSRNFFGDRGDGGTYEYRARASNSAGTDYGSILTITIFTI